MRRFLAVLSWCLGFSLPLYSIRWEWFGFSWNIVSTLMFFTGGIWLVINSNRISVIRLLQHPIHWIYVLWVSIGVWQSDWSISAIGIAVYVYLLPWIIGAIALLDTSISQTMKRGIMYGALLVALISIGQVLYFWGVEYRPTAFYHIGLDQALSKGGFSNYIAMYLVLVYTIGLSQTGRYINSWKGIIIIGILSTQSLVGISTLIMIHFVNRFWWETQPRRSSRWKLVAISLAIVLFIIWQVPTEKIQNLADMSQRNSVSTRLQIWDTTLALVPQYWWQGVGIDGYQQAYSLMVPRLYFPPHEWLVPHPHNLILFLWSVGGILGLLWVIMLWRECFQRFYLRHQGVLVLGAFFLLGFFDTPMGRIDTSVIWWIASMSVIGKNSFDTKKGY